MKIQYNKKYSENLGREMEWKQYGDKGQGVLVFPSQNQRFFEWEDNGMVDVLSPLIDAGKIHLICCDSIDSETWSLYGGDHHTRIELHERWFRYITEELIPSVNEGEKLIVTGCSMGGYHAGNEPKVVVRYEILPRGAAGGQEPGTPDMENTGSADRAAP